MKIKLIIIAISLFLLTGCINTKSYSKELTTIFSNQKGSESTYFGLAEYGHKLTLSSIKKKKTQATYIFEGYMDDARGEDNREFKITYIIDHESIREIINNKDVLRKNDNTLNSIIPNQIILKLPLEVGNSWEQTFIYKDKEYTAITEIVKIIDADEQTQQFVTTTTVNNIKGFFDDTYFEEKTYEVGKGIISFINTQEVYEINKGRKLTKEDFLFGYSRRSNN